MPAAPVTPPDSRPRCAWCLRSAGELDYHDREWGLPCRDEQALFELLVLESFQAGLSWQTILAKREAFRRAFDGFDAVRMAAYGDADAARLMADAGIVRNRAKIQAATANARAVLALREAGPGLAGYLWGFVDGEPIQNQWRGMAEVPAVTPLAEVMAKDMKRRGFAFLGPTTLYAHMQAMGMVNDHVVDCFRWREVRAAAGIVGDAGR